MLGRAMTERMKKIGERIVDLDCEFLKLGKLEAGRLTLRFERARKRGIFIPLPSLEAPK
jgi:hypothetical protein